MAIKQNNTETNGNGSNNVQEQTKSNSSGVKMQKLSTNSDGADVVGCGVGVGAKPKVGVFKANKIDSAEDNQEIETEGLNVNNQTMQNTMPSIETILKFMMAIESYRQEQQPDRINQLYDLLIVELAKVKTPKNMTPIEIKEFSEDINKVYIFLREQDERCYYRYLNIVCKLITQYEGDPPSFAICIIFKLFRDETIVKPVRNLLEHQKLHPKSIQRTVTLLCNWMSICFFCENINMCIMAILKWLQDQQQYEVLDDIAIENIDALFKSLIVPVIRARVAPVVLFMLQNSNNPQVFEKMLAKFMMVCKVLKKPASNDDLNTLRQLLEIACNYLQCNYSRYRELYGPVKQLLKDLKVNYKSSNDGNSSYAYGQDSLLLHNTNVKTGLVNLGNTCYMNSVLQALAMTKEFRREILLSQSKSPLLMKMQQQIGLMIYSTRYELTPSRVLNATRPPGFSPGLQQDSSEFLGYLLETLHEQEMIYRQKLEQQTKVDKEEDHIQKKVNGASALTTSSSCNNHSDNHTNCQSNAIEKNISSNPSTIDKTFTGSLATTYKCLTCGWKSRNVDDFRDLQLSFPELKNECASNYSVQDLLEYYCSPEKLYGENQYFCERCKKLTDAERYINVISAPRNLILTLKHFKYDQKYHMRAKLMHKVFHDEKVSIKVCSNNETMAEISSVHYDLYAGVVHSGFSMDSGHYYTYASDAPNNWYKFNDSIVTTSQSEELHNLTPPNTPYILFYQMAAQVSEETENAASNKLTKIEEPAALKLNDLPQELQDYITDDNSAFKDELQMRRLKNTNALQNAYNINRGGGNSKDDYDDEEPSNSGGGSCGGNALNFNANRFVF